MRLSAVYEPLLLMSLGVLAFWGCDRHDTLAGAPADPPSARAVVTTAAPVDSALPVASGSPATPKAYTRPSKEELKSRLTARQYEVTQEEGTEPPFRNEFWDNHQQGLYVDITTGEPLFSSTDKFESGTGWPSFTRPLEQGHVVQKGDDTLGMSRMEVRSKVGDAHLGHVFDDGPKPTGLRYCINSASLRFIPVDKLEAEGYGDYKRLFVPAK